MLDPVIDFLTSALNFVNAYVGNFGMSIIIITAFIRLLLMPLMMSQTRSMVKMQELQPEIEKLQNKYEDDPERLNEETMRLWQEHDVNPASGCLPLIVQLPILWGFFRALLRYEDIKNAGFLWIQDVGVPDPYYILPIIAAVATYFQSKATSSAGGGGSMQAMTYMMPLFIGFISARYPAGLALYWITSALFSIGQKRLVEIQQTQEEGATS